MLLDVQVARVLQSLNLRSKAPSLDCSQTPSLLTLFRPELG